MTRIFFMLLVVILPSCGSEPLYNPKPRSFPKIDFPERNLVTFDEDYCSFTFEYPDYASIIKDKFFFEGKPADECWFDVKIPAFNGDLHCSYISLENRAHFDKMVNDAFTMVGKHNIKAQSRDDFTLKNKNDVSGMLFEIHGEVASNLQFYLTDSVDHFFRASLYFNSRVNQDSITPIYDFVKQDVLHVIETFAWMNE